MSTLTARLGLYKPADDGSEAANVSTDINGNADVLENAVGAVPTVSVPTTSFDGKIVHIAHRAWFADGALPGGVFRELKVLPTATIPAATVANTTTETVMATITIPAGEAIAGRTYKLVAFGVASVTGTPTITLRTRLGGIGGTLQANSGARTASSGISNHAWKLTTELVCLTTGVGGTGYLQQHTTESVSVAGSPVWVNPASIIDGQLAGAWNTTIAQSLVVTCTWSAASASNTCTLHGAYLERSS